jgi:hypothetical protein
VLAAIWLSQLIVGSHLLWNAATITTTTNHQYYLEPPARQCWACREAREYQSGWVTVSQERQQLPGTCKRCCSQMPGLMQTNR